MYISRQKPATFEHFGLLELCGQGPPNIIRKLARSFLVPPRQNTFGVERRELLLDPIRELEIYCDIPLVLFVSQNSDRFARIMIAVVKEKDDFAANLLLETSSRHDFSDQKSLGKKSARLLAETNNRVIHASK